MGQEETQTVNVRGINVDLWWQFRLLGFKRKVSVRVLLEEAIKAKLKKEGDKIK